MSTALSLEKWLSGQPGGQIILPGEVPLFAGQETICNLLAKATCEGRLDELATGIYAKPNYHPLLGRLAPGPEAVAEAIARRDGVRLIPTGAFALNRLGLSTQVPMRIVFLTNGSARLLKVGKAEIEFRPASPWLFELEGRLSLLVALALQELGEASVDEEASEKLMDALVNEGADHMEHDLQIVPSWMQQYFTRAIALRKRTG